MLSSSLGFRSMLFPTFHAIFENVYGQLHRLHFHTWRSSGWWVRDDRRFIRLSFIRLILLSHKEKLELVPLLSHFASEQRGITRHRLKKLVGRLDNGTPLIDALEQTPGCLSDEDILLLRFGYHSGIYSTALDELFRRNLIASEKSNSPLLTTILYHGLFLMIVLIFGRVISENYAPIFREIFIDYGLVAKNSFTHFAPIVIQFLHQNLLSITVGFFAILLAVFAINPFRVFNRTFGSTLIKSIRKLRSAGLLRLLAMSLDAGRPLPGSIATLARYHFDRSFRAKLLFTRNEIELGEDPYASLAAQGILAGNEAQSLKALSNSATRGWLMRKLADQRDNEVSRYSELVVSFLHPLFVCLFGVFVLLLALSILGSLTELVHSLG